MDEKDPRHAVPMRGLDETMRRVHALVVKTTQEAANVFLLAQLKAELKAYEAEHGRLPEVGSGQTQTMGYHSRLLTELPQKGDDPDNLR